MTGKRTGRPNQVRSVKECKGCGRVKTIAGRQLCESCYIYAQKMGIRHEFPTNAERQSARADVCHCYAPIPEALPLWDAAQCKKCGRKIP